LVFLDPPYLYGSDRSDQQGYNANRFSVAELQALSEAMRHLVSIGAHVAFCWSEQAVAVVPPEGIWIVVGRDYLWLSEGLSIARSIGPALKC
jgi:hypothetical protein